MVTMHAPTLTDKVIREAERKGKLAGKTFVETYNLGTNVMVDTLFHDGILSGATIIVERLPWLTAVSSVVSSLRTFLKGSGIPFDTMAREEADTLILDYLSAYDQASRAVILDTVKYAKGKDTHNARD